MKRLGHYFALRILSGILLIIIVDTYYPWWVGCIALVIWWEIFKQFWIKYVGKNEEDDNDE